MLHAPITETKQQADQACRNTAPVLEGELHPQLAGSRGHVAAHQPIEQLQRSIGNQRVQWLFQARRAVSEPAILASRKLSEASGGVPGPEGECAACRGKRLTRQPQATNSTMPSVAPPIVQEVLRSPGQPLDTFARTFFERRFGCDFCHVRVHTDAKAAESALAVNALAYAVGRNIVFAQGEYRPSVRKGREILAHELTHVIQQGGSPGGWQVNHQGAAAMPYSVNNRAESEAERAAFDAGNDVSEVYPVRERLASRSVQRQVFGTPSRVSIRSPVFEELVTQETVVASTLGGRQLKDPEIQVAQKVFGDSIDYSRVRLLSTGVSFLEFRTVGNTIRVPRGFQIGDEEMAQTFIHELTHVWQYQHGGTSYISVSLATQIAGTIRTGSRNIAYCYRPKDKKSFFEYTPEQQAMIVENFFAMVRDRDSSEERKSEGFYPNYDWVCHSDPKRVPWAERSAEIARELPLHEPLIQQMKTALPKPQAEILLQSASEVMQIPGEGIAPVTSEKALMPVKPIIKVTF